MGVVCAYTVKVDDVCISNGEGGGPLKWVDVAVAVDLGVRHLLHPPLSELRDPI